MDIKNIKNIYVFLNFFKCYMGSIYNLLIEVNINFFNLIIGYKVFLKIKFRKIGQFMVKLYKIKKEIGGV